MGDTFYFYIVRCSDSSFYCGQTNNLKRRMHEHNSHPTKSARYTKFRRPVELVYFEKYSTLRLAIRREREVKKWSKFKKELLVVGNENNKGKKANE
ncbi:GIY-YIG nuclease family protein [Candidatus Roizmanbacteria bacterium]|nr:GIY-YIG nuclease family protein [Candidatus Roizmanbacteria bacterium]